MLEYSRRIKVLIFYDFLSKEEVENEKRIARRDKERRRGSY